MLTTLQQLQPALASLSNRRPAEITLETPVSDLAADSFALVELVVGIQQDTGKQLSPARLQSVVTVEDLCRAVEAAT